MPPPGKTRATFRSKPSEGRESRQRQRSGVVERARESGSKRHEVMSKMRSSGDAQSDNLTILRGGTV